jgi:hypothetical protein
VIQLEVCFTLKLTIFGLPDKHPKLSLTWGGFIAKGLSGWVCCCASKENKIELMK